MDWQQDVAENCEAHTLEDLIVAARHFEDLEIFVGQRSRMHPGPGWAVVLDMLRRDLDHVRAAVQARDPDVRAAK